MVEAKYPRGVEASEKSARSYKSIGSYQGDIGNPPVFFRCWLPAASGKTFPVTDPATSEVIAQVAEGDKEDIEHGVKAARRAFEAGAWPTMSPSARGKLIWRIGELILEHLDELAELESLDNHVQQALAAA